LLLNWADLFAADRRDTSACFAFRFKLQCGLARKLLGRILPAHFFWLTDFASSDTRMSWQAVVERTVIAMGYELVGTDRTSGGLLRVFIDKAADFPLDGGEHPVGSHELEGVDVDDCERVTRQLQHVLEVENHGYSRLEVSSPGLDRPLKKAADYRRFAGAHVDLTLHHPIMGRKKFRGELLARGDGWGLMLDESVARPRGDKNSASEPAARERDQVLEFSLDDVREAKLVPVLDFKSRRHLPAAPAATRGHAVRSRTLADGGRRR